jgi:hypothetical protein
MITVPAPSPLNGETLRDELGQAGLDRNTDFYITGDDMHFALPANLRDRLVAVLQNHKGRPSKPVTTPDQVRLASLESWAAATDEAMNALILDSLLASLSDEDLLADLGGL